MAQYVFVRDELKINEYLPRSKFITGKPFDGLDDYLKSNEINVFNRNIKCDLRNLDKSTPLENGLMHKIGSFYEHLIQGIYGGELKEQYKIKNNQGIEKIIKPDLSSEYFDRDAKSVSPGRYLKLKDNQMAGYSILETGKYSSKKEITFEIFRHSENGLLSKFSEDDIQAINKQFPKSTKFLISMPFRVAFDIYSSGKCSWQKEVLSPSCSNTKYRKSHGSYMRLDSGPLNALLAYPEETLKYFNVEMSGLKIIKSRFPEGVKINRFAVTPFPILIIENQDSKIWNTKFLDIISKKNETLPDNFNLWMEELISEIEHPQETVQLEPEEQPEEISNSEKEDNVPF